MDPRVSKDMISSGMSYSGNQSKEDLGRTQYGSVARPDVLMNAYQSMYSQDTEEVKEARVDKRLPEHERSGARLKRYDNPSGALALGGGQQRARRADHEARRGVKKEEYISEAPNLGTGGTAQDMINRRQATQRTPLRSFRQTQRNFGQDYKRQELVLANRAAGGSGLADIRGAQRPAPAPPTVGAPAEPAAPAPPRTSTPPTITTPPRPGTQAAGPESIKPKTPNPLMQRTFGYQTGNAPDQIAKASAGVSKEKSDAAFAKTKEDIKTKLKPSADLKMSLDIFDLVKGHLLDEGYADTEQAALVIMANMSEEWKQSIVEVMTVTDADRKAGTEASKRLEKGMKGYQAGPDYKGPVQLRLPGV